MCLPYYKKNLLFEILWKYSYLINIFINQKTWILSKIRMKSMKKLGSITNGFKNQVGIFYSYQTIWIALVRPPLGGYCYLNHTCIVIYLCPHWLSKLKSKWSFLIRSTSSGWGTGYVPSLSSKETFVWNTLKIFPT